MKVNRKFLRSAERLSLSAIAKDSAAQKIVSAVTAIGFVMQPVAALASTITRADKPDANLATSPVTKIFAENVFGNVAINKFDKFQLDANHIANMYFGMSETSNSAANLVNFVDSRIDINGTVNAIQNKKIDGNLFFFSSDGMAVGKTGVINAGALYVATPTSTKFDEYKKLDKEDKFNTIIKDEGFAQIPINASGTISVLGKVNAVNAVNLRAAKIGVGKNVSGEAFDGVAADATVTEPGASIRTGVVDFKDIVNVGNANSGLTDDALIAEQTGSGDIVLAAYNNYNDNYSVTDDFSKIAGESVNAEQLLRRLQLSRAKAAAIAVINWARTQMRTAARKPKSWRILLPKNVQLCSSWCRMLPVCARAQMMARIIPSRQISSAPRRPLILKALSMQARLRLMLKPAAKLSMLLLPAAYLPAMTVVKLVFLTSWVIS